MKKAEQKNRLPKEIEVKLDQQLSELKKMILDNYDNATADKMELDVLSRVQNIGKTSMQGYMEKKLQI